MRLREGELVVMKSILVYLVLKIKIYNIVNKDYKRSGNFYMKWKEWYRNGNKLKY